MYRGPDEKEKKYADCPSHPPPPPPRRTSLQYRNTRPEKQMRRNEIPVDTSAKGIERRIPASLFGKNTRTDSLQQEAISIGDRKRVPLSFVYRVKFDSGLDARNILILYCTYIAT